MGRRRKPGFIESCNPSEVDKPPTGKIWGHEIKWDGYRGQAHLDNGAVQIFTRAGNDWSVTFHPISETISRLRATSAILDGEVVALKGGVSDFHELRRQLGKAHPAIVYQVFDLLWLDGEDLRPLPYRDRKERLADLIGKASRHLAYVEHLEIEGRRMYASACKLHLEGIVSKRLDSPYGSGRSTTWFKTRCEVSETFTVVGYTPDDNGRVEGLYLASGKGSELAYAGTVERGFGAGDLAELDRRLSKLVVRQPQLQRPPRKPAKAKWVVPKVMVEVRYPNKSADGRLRHPSYKGLRDDLTKA